MHVRFITTLVFSTLLVTSVFLGQIPSVTGEHTLEIARENIKSYDEIEYRAILYQDGLRIEGNTQKISKLRLD